MILITIVCMRTSLCIRSTIRVPSSATSSHRMLAVMMSTVRNCFGCRFCSLASKYGSVFLLNALAEGSGERIQYKLDVLMLICVRGTAPSYDADEFLRMLDLEA